MLKKIIQTPYKLRNNRDTVKTLVNSLNTSSSSSSIGLPMWLQFVQYDEENESIKFSKHLLSEGEVAAYQQGTFNTSIFDSLPQGSKTNKGILQVGAGINVIDGTISLDSAAVTPQTLSFSNNSLSISNGNSVDLSSLETDLSAYYTKTQTNTLLNGKAPTIHSHTFASLVNKPTTLSGFGITDAATATDLSTGLATKSNTNHTHTFASLTSKPTTLSGYGISDAATALALTNGLATKANTVHSHSFASLTSKPTTLSGYGITDAATALALTNGLATKANTSHTHSISNVSGLQTALNSKVNNTLFNSLFELKTDSLGTQYIQAKHSLLSVGEISAYKSDEINVGSLFDHLPVASSTNLGLVQIGSGLTVTDGVVAVDGDIFNLSNYYTKTETNTLLGGKANTSHTHSISNVTNLQSSLNAKANKNGSSTENFTVKNLTIHGTVNHWLADVITIDDAKLQLNRSQGGATVASGLDIYNGTSVVSSLNYTTAGNWQFTNGDIYQGGTKVALQNVSISAGNGLSGGGAISANRTITLGTPSTISATSTNSVSSTSHTHNLDLSAATANNANRLGNVLASNYLRSDIVDKFNHLYVGYDWASKRNGIQIGVDGLNSGLSFYEPSVATSASIFRDTDSKFYVGVRGGNRDMGIAIDQNGVVSIAGNVVATQNVSILAGNGLSGGGAISANRTITLGTPSTISSTSTNSVTASSHTHAISLSKADIGLGNVGNYSDYARKTISESISGSWSFSGLPTINRSGEDVTLLRFNTERQWQFRQISSGATAGLALVSEVDAKSFDIRYFNGVRAVSFQVGSVNAYARLVPDGNGSVFIGATTTINADTTVNGVTTSNQFIGTNDTSNTTIAAGTSKLDGYGLLTNRADSYITSAGRIRFSTNSSVHSGSGNVLMLEGLNATFGGNISAVNGTFSGTLGVSSNLTAMNINIQNAITAYGDITSYYGDVNAVNANITSVLNLGANNTSVANNIFKLSNLEFTDSNDVIRTKIFGSGGNFSLYDSSGVQGVSLRGSDGILNSFINNRLVVGAGWITTAPDNTYMLYVNGNQKNTGDILALGNITAQGEITAYQSSDKRLKSNITPITSSLSIIEKLNPVTFQWNEKAVELNDNKNTLSKNYGVIAQEIEEVLPELIHKTNGYKSVDYIQLIGVLLGAVKELNNKIKNLENR